jgi:hypothetical protein
MQVSYIPSFMDWTKKNNYVETAAAFSVSTTVHRATVPADKRWIVLHINCYRDVNATLDITMRSVTPKLIGIIADEAAATGNKWYDSSLNWVLDEGEYIQFEFGVAQGAGAFLSVVVLESTKLV